MPEAQPILPLADLVARHDEGTGAATDTIWSAWSVNSRAGRAVWAWANDLPLLAGDLVYVDDQLRALHGERAGQQPRDPGPAVSAVTAAMIRHVQVRGSDRRIRPLAPDAQAALTDYLAERIALMDALRCLGGRPGASPRLRRPCGPSAGSPPRSGAAPTCCWPRSIARRGPDRPERHLRARARTAATTWLQQEGRAAARPRRP